MEPGDVPDGTAEQQEGGRVGVGNHLNARRDALRCRARHEVILLRRRQSPRRAGRGDDHEVVHRAFRRQVQCRAGHREIARAHRAVEFDHRLRDVRLELLRLGGRFLIPGTAAAQFGPPDDRLFPRPLPPILRRLKRQERAECVHPDVLAPCLEATEHGDAAKGLLLRGRWPARRDLTAVGEHVGGHDHRVDAGEIEAVEPLGNAVGVALGREVAEPVARRPDDLGVGDGAGQLGRLQANGTVVERDQGDAGQP